GAGRRQGRKDHAWALHRHRDARPQPAGDGQSGKQALLLRHRPGCADRLAPQAARFPRSPPGRQAGNRDQCAQPRKIRTQGQKRNNLLRKSMRGKWGFVAGVTFLLGTAVPQAAAQVEEKMVYNPYTGRYVAASSAYNPYTGASAAGRASYNPATGTRAEEGAAY